MQPEAQHSPSDAKWQPWFFVAVAMMALAVAVSLAAVMEAVLGDNDDTKATATSADSDAPEEYSQKLRVLATWYNLEGGAFPPDSPDYGTTSTGTQADWGTCAVDPSVIPLYTRFFVPGYGWCEALDTGGGVVGYHIDLFFPDEEGDPGWGEQYVDIYIVD